jgi:hypothetical protein
MAIKITPTRGVKSASIGMRQLLPTLIAATMASQAHALEFSLGEVEGRFDSQISMGASWRLNDPDSDLISSANGGTGVGSGSFDDGNQNFKQGDAFSKTFKGIHELTLDYQNVGLLVRGKYWADFELNSGKRAHGNTVNGYQSGDALDDDGFNDYAKFTGAEILDAYVYGYFDVGSMPVDVRLGRQVINWGESTFIQGGLNSINAYDVSAFRRPGAEVKEALLPANQAFASIGLTDNLSLEAFYQFTWEQTVEEGCGTYFSVNDFAAEGCDGIRIGNLNVPDATYYNTLSTDMTQPWLLTGTDVVVRRNEDGVREGSDDGQFGLAARYFSESLNNTEFGFYFARYNSRLPVVSGIKTPVADLNQVQTAISPAIPAIRAATIQSLAAAGVDVTDPNNTALIQSSVLNAVSQVVGLSSSLNSEYFTEYPDDIKMIGVSWNTNLGDVAWSGEVSHKWDAPLQMNGPMLVESMLTLGTAAGNPANTLVQNTAFGGTIQGYDTFDITQVQSTFIKTVNNVMGASRLALVGELGWTHIHDFDEGSNAIKYGRSGVYGYSSTDDDGFVTQDSVGYVLRTSLYYPSAFAGVNLTPTVSFKHGVYGYGPQPGATFSEGQKSLNLSLTADYLERYSVQLSYTNFFGGKYNELEDRDYISLSASVAF